MGYINGVRQKNSRQTPAASPAGRGLISRQIALRGDHANLPRMRREFFRLTFKIMITRQAANQIAENFWWRKFFARATEFRWQMRAKKIAENMRGFIPANSNVLDIGSGSGNVAKEISLKTGANLTLLDVIDWNITDLPFALFNGTRIPFSDKKFDIALLFDVVHHSENEEILIKEAMRVAKKVIVLEEIHNNVFLKVWANIMDNFQWIMFGMPLAFHSKSEKQWKYFLGKFCKSIQSKRESFGHAIFIME